MTDDGRGAQREVPAGAEGRADPRLIRAVRADEGGPDPRLARALGADDGGPAARSEVLAALAGARVFLALSAEALGTEESAVPGLRQESSAQMSLLSLVSSTGARALPAFLDGHQVQRWRHGARPVPVAGPLACRTALEDGAEALLLDPAGAAVVLRGPALRELAEGRVPVPGAALSTRASEAPLTAAPPAPPALLAALAAALRAEPVVAARLLAGPDGPVLGLVPDRPLPPAGLAALAARVRERLGADLPAAGLDLAVVPREGPGETVPVRRGWRERRRQR